MHNKVIVSTKFSIGETTYMEVGKSMKINFAPRFVLHNIENLTKVFKLR